MAIAEKSRRVRDEYGSARPRGSTVTTRICHLLWSCLPHPHKVSAPICHSPSHPRPRLNFRGSPRILPSHLFIWLYELSLPSHFLDTREKYFCFYQSPSLGSEGNHEKQKAGENIIKQAAMFQLQQAAKLGNFCHVVLALESRIEERSHGISLMTQESR